MDYIIGIDGGGTKTEAVAYSLDGDEIASFVSGFGNILIDKDTALKNIIGSADECIKKVKSLYGTSKCLMIYAGLAGVEAGDNKEYVREILKQHFNTRANVVNDAVIAHASLLNGEDGILTISGTGSISLGRKGNRFEKAGGWGHLLGDEGSGYYISIKALKKAALEEDLGVSKSVLTLELMKFLNIKEVECIKEFVYSSDKGKIASLAPVVAGCADKDEYAKKILIEAGEDLSNITYMAASRLNIKSSVKVGIKGSIITKIDIVKKVFKESLDKKLEDVIIVEKNIPSAKGGYYLAVKELLKN